MVREKFLKVWYKIQQNEAKKNKLVTLESGERSKEGSRKESEDRRDNKQKRRRERKEVLLKKRKRRNVQSRKNKENKEQRRNEEENREDGERTKFGMENGKNLPFRCVVRNTHFIETCTCVSCWMHDNGNVIHRVTEKEGNKDLKLLVHNNLLTASGVYCLC